MPIKSDPQRTALPDVKKRIMEAAGQLFADKGFDATSISDIAEAADVGRALIYYYFKDKRDLHASILREGGERIIAAAQNAYAYEGTAIDRLRQFAVQFREVHVDYPNNVRIAMRTQIEDSLTFETHAKEHVRKVFGILEEIVVEGVERGELRDVDPVKTVHMAMGIIHSLVMMHIHGISISHPEKDIDFAMSVLASGIELRK